MKKQMLAVLTIVSAGLVAGCGGSGTNSPTAATGSSTSSVTGKVADGYLVNATVFMDKNGNYQLDPGEPSAITDQNGAYAMTVDAADVGKYPIVAIATKGMTIDKDTGLAIPNSYVLSMPATAVSGAVSGSNFISPMSSQLREMMETGKYATMQEAMSDLSTKLGMPAGTNMLTDYMVSNNTAMHTAAQNMASLMGSQMSQVLSTSGTSTTVDVNRYRGMMGTIFSNISSITGPNAQSAMSSLMSSMTTNLTNITVGQPFRNMSTAFRGGMMGGTSNTATTTPTTMPTTMMAPGAPSGVIATGGSQQVTLSWPAVSGATSYNIYYSTTPGVTSATGTKIAGATSPYVLTGLAASTTYYYVVTAMNSIGESVASAQTTAATMMPSFNALAYYNTTCLGCHGSLGVRTAAQIQTAINNNIGGMGSLSLTSAQIAAIAAVSH
ncbi:MAG: fibronectin type III domain-containing protein [Desulfuromonadaceae bacterium]|nr:fibronectin type III domain-containing protein [Desulfuromonadaceae bacterium]